MTKLLSMLTEDEYKDGKTIVILAGYRDDMNKMLSLNVGLRSRFKEKLEFPDWSEDTAADFIVKEVARAKPVAFALRKNELDDSDATEQAKALIREKVGVLRRREGWANVRDVKENLVPAMISRRDRRVARKAKDAEEAEPLASTVSPPAIVLDDIIGAFDAMLAERPRTAAEAAAQAASENARALGNGSFAFNVDAAPSHPHNHNQNRQHNQRATRNEDEEGNEQQEQDEKRDGDGGDAGAKRRRKYAARDSGVTDDDWEEVQQALKDKEAKEEREKKEQAAAEEQERRDREELEELERKRKQAEKEKREAEERRLEKEIAEKRRRMEEERRAREAEENKRRQEQELEQKRQAKLRQIGQCIMGFDWIKVSGGYRCAAGGHFVSDAQIGI
jgi:hypothetical protein